jgi:hypothetical protein
LQKSSMILSKALLPNISNARAFGFKKFSWLKNRKIITQILKTLNAYFRMFVYVLYGFEFMTMGLIFELSPWKDWEITSPS